MSRTETNVLVWKLDHRRQERVSLLVFTSSISSPCADVGGGEVQGEAFPLQKFHPWFRSVRSETTSFGRPRSWSGELSHLQMWFGSNRPNDVCESPPRFPMAASTVALGPLKQVWDRRRRQRGDLSQLPPANGSTPHKCPILSFLSPIYVSFISPRP